MAAVTIRNLSEETHRALKVRAAEHGQSTEAEIRAILDQVVRPTSRPRLGSLLAQIGREANLTNKDYAVFEAVRDRESSEPIRFE